MRLGCQDVLLYQLVQVDPELVDTLLLVFFEQLLELLLCRLQLCLNHRADFSESIDQVLDCQSLLLVHSLHLRYDEFQASTICSEVVLLLHVELVRFVWSVALLLLFVILLL